MLSVDFKTPISFEMTVNKIEEVSTQDGTRVWLEGMGYFGGHDEKTGFYCPEELEYLLRDISVNKGDRILIMYLGFSRKGGRKKEFYVRPAEPERVMEKIFQPELVEEEDPPIEVEISEIGTTTDPEAIIDTGGTGTDEYEEEPIDFDAIMKEIEEEE